MLRSARWIVGSGGGTTDPGRLRQRHGQLRVDLPRWPSREVRIDRKDVLPLHPSSAGIGRPPLRLKPSFGPKIGTTPNLGSASVAWLDDVEGSDEAVTEAIGRYGELDRHERPPVPVGGLVVVQVDHRRLPGDLLVHGAIGTDELVADEAREEVMDDGPLVVPAGQPARGLEDPFATHALRPGVVDYPVVELSDGLVQLDDDEVLVVARFRDDRPAVAVTRHVEDAIGVQPHQKLVPVVRVVELRVVDGPAPVDGVEVVARRSEVDRPIGIRLLGERAACGRT